MTWRRQLRGHAAIEASFSLLVILGFVLGMFTILQYQRAIHSSTLAASEGVRNAASRVSGERCTSTCVALIESHTKAAGNSYNLDIDSVTVTVTGPGKTVIVHVRTNIPVFGDRQFPGLRLFGTHLVAEAQYVGYLPAHSGVP